MPRPGVVVLFFSVAPPNDVDDDLRSAFPFVPNTSEPLLIAELGRQDGGEQCQSWWEGPWFDW
jgi:hypothetical protein|tara:strand:- start:49 stop:237 length:189 start_codon:yes stop_codon:yes gene_type:complete